MASHDKEHGFAGTSEPTSPDGEVDLMSLLDAVAVAPPLSSPSASGASVMSTTASRVATRGALPAQVLLDADSAEPTSQDLHDAMAEALAAMGADASDQPPITAAHRGNKPARDETSAAAATDAAVEDDASDADDASDTDGADDASDTDDADDDSMFESAPVSPRNRRHSDADAAPTTSAAARGPAPSHPMAMGIANDAAVAAAVDASPTDDDALAADHASQEDALHAATGKLVLALGDLLSVCRAPSPDAHAVRHAAEAARAAISASTPPWRLRCLGRAIWRDEVWIAIDASTANAALAWTQALNAIGRTTIVCTGEAESRALYEGVRALAIGAHRQTTPSPDGAGALQWIAEPTRADAESFAFAAVDGLIELCKELIASPGRWPLRRVTDALDLVEEALDARPGGVMRAIALGHADGAVPRHATEAAIVALTALRAVDASTASARTIAHVSLGCALMGTAGGQPPDIAEAAARFLERLGLEAPIASDDDSATATASRRDARGDNSPLELHLLRVIALTNWLAAGNDGPEPAGPDRLTRLLHALVRRRCAEGRVARPWIELCLAERADPALQTWSDALPALLGETPAGSVVRLHDGSRGVVVEATAAGRMVEAGGRVQAVQDATPLQTHT